jgi:hypothetical protein
VGEALDASRLFALTLRFARARHDGHLRPSCLYQTRVTALTVTRVCSTLASCHSRNSRPAAMRRLHRARRSKIGSN